MRYVMNNPMSWPEPAAVVLMVMFSFIGGAAVSAPMCTCGRSAGERCQPGDSPRDAAGG